MKETYEEFVEGYGLREPHYGWTPQEFADYVGLHVMTVYRRMDKGEIPVGKLSPRRRFIPHSFVRRVHSPLEEVTA